MGLGEKTAHLFARVECRVLHMIVRTYVNPEVLTRAFNPLMAELILLGRSFYLRMTLTYHISGPVGF